MDSTHQSTSPTSVLIVAPLPGQSVPVSSGQSMSDLQQSSQAERLESSRGVQREQLDDAVSKLNDYVQSVQRDLQFEVDNELGTTVVRVVDQETQEVIRQIPDEVALRLAENLLQDEPLTLFNIKV